MQPGFEFLETVVRPIQHQVPSAVVVFVGFTAKPAPGFPALVPTAVADYNAYFNLFGGPVDANASERMTKACLSRAVQHYFDNGGGTCFILSVGVYDHLKDISASELATCLSTVEVFSAIARNDDISLLALPDLALFDDKEAASVQQVWQQVMMRCEASDRLFALLDPPASFEAAKVCFNWLNSGIRAGASHAAAWWPWLVIREDDGDGRSNAVVIPPSAAVAAQLQATDRNPGIWKAPANGERLRKVIKPQYPVQQGEQLFDANRASINLIRSFPARGTRVWGCRTLAGAEQGPVGRFVHTRRLASYIHYNLAARARYSIFEPNNEITWMKLRAGLSLWLSRLWSSGGLAGFQEDEAYKVMVGVGQTMTSDDVTDGILIVEVMVALHYPAEFIQLTIRLNMKDSSQGEAVSRANVRSAIS